ncbi:hypothetical protein EEL33_01160 [Muribaculaceae bacterium Isolate-037 (Harlan)]|nr:hypothetical protein EEL33_01160 [Muribaculaceae bacterium Isolate-037 (Harlan)]
MNMTILQRAVLAIVKEVAQDKKNRNILPGDVMRSEISVAVSKTLEQLTEMGELTHRLLSVNKIDAYAIPEASS